MKLQALLPLVTYPDPVSPHVGSNATIVSAQLEAELHALAVNASIPVVSNVAVEYHGPRILHAALSGDVMPEHWLHLIGAILLGLAWLFAAAWLFRRRGWQ